MSRLKRDRARSKLARLLAEADDEAFCQLVWSVDALQHNREEAVSGLLVFPAEARTPPFTSPMRVHSWYLETLVNELLATPKVRLREGRNMVTDCRQFNAIVKAVNYLRDYENQEDGLVLDRVDFFDDAPRLAHRQFPWQRGFESAAQIYRSHFVFGGPFGRDYFSKRYGLTPAEFALCGVLTYAALEDRPWFNPHQRLTEFSVTEEQYQAALGLIARDHAVIRSMASEHRSTAPHVAYRLSVLRPAPCIIFGGGARLRAPLRELILQRVSAGIYYDTVGAGSDVRREVGARFEEYCLDYFTRMLPDLQATPAYRYGRKGKERETPDIFLRLEGEVRLVIECKAKRMPYRARAGEDPLNTADARAGMEEIAHGIFQIWRFASLVRRGVLHEAVSPDMTGMVLTLDPWLTMSRGQYGKLVERAKAIAADEDPEIGVEDQCPVALVPIEDAEGILRSATGPQFLAFAARAACEEASGWHMPGLFKEVAPDAKVTKEYPYGDDAISVLLPWWRGLGEASG